MVKEVENTNESTQKEDNNQKNLPDDRNVTIMGIIIVCIIVVYFFLNQGGSSNTLAVHRSDFGSSWPFTVDSGTLKCLEGDAIVIETGRGTYALNGLAMQAGYNAARDYITLTDSNGLFKDPTLIMQRTFELCR